MYERSRHLMDCHIAGFTYYDGLNVIDELKLGTIVTLKSEPDNPHDPEAVSIYYKDSKLGYIPKAKNFYMSKLLYFNHGEIYEAKINFCNLKEKPEHQFRIVVKLIDNRRAGS